MNWPTNLLTKLRGGFQGLLQRPVRNQVWQKHPEGGWWDPSRAPKTTSVQQILGAENRRLTPTIQQKLTTPAPKQSEIERKMKKGLIEYGGKDLPLLKLVPQMVEATRRYPVFQHNPYLLPELGILETSGGRNVTRPNSFWNWGINYPGNLKAFEKMTAGEILERMVTGMGERSTYYKPFRTGKPLTEEEINSFSGVYSNKAPKYGRNLSAGMEWFAKQ